MGTIEQRLLVLEEVAAIERLKYEYGRLIDEGLAGQAPFPQAALLDQFSEDAIWQANVHGRFEGRDEIGAFFARVAESVSFSLHYMVNPIIDLAPSLTEATGHWLTFETLTVNGQAAWLAATYDDVYTKAAGRWQFQQVTAQISFMTPYEHGWARQPFLGEAA